MDNLIWIVLIVAVTVILVLILFRRTLSKFFLKANRDGVEAGLEIRDAVPDPLSPNETAPSPSINISGNRQIGSGNKISVARPDVNVSDNTQAGQKQTIEVKSDKK